MYWASTDLLMIAPTWIVVSPTRIMVSRSYLGQCTEFPQCAHDFHPLIRIMIFLNALIGTPWWTVLMKSFSCTEQATPSALMYPIWIMVSLWCQLKVFPDVFMIFRRCTEHHPMYWTPIKQVVCRFMEPWLHILLMEETDRLRLSCQVCVRKMFDESQKYKIWVLFILYSCIVI